MRYNFLRSIDKLDSIHEKLSDENRLMINAMLGESYIPPHKHTEPEKTEIFRIVKGDVEAGEDYLTKLNNQLDSG